MPARGGEMGDVDRGDGVVSRDFHLSAGRQAPERRLHLHDGKRAAQTARVNLDR